jgi:predicted DNA-binding protein (MmcQ/YjbR family)
MDNDTFNQFCKSLPATTHVVQWGNSDVWKVGGKVFAIGGWGKTGIPAFVFKTSDVNYQFLNLRKGFRPAPYLASRGFKWIQQFEALDPNDLIYQASNTKALSLEEELKYYITESYAMVSNALSKKKQRELGITV